MNLIFHIGLHKTGTSWLQQVFFRQHPEICLLSNSMRPWDDPLVKYIVAESDRHFDYRVCQQIYRRQLDNRGWKEEDGAVLVSAERLSGHPWSGGFDTFRIASRIHEAFPRAGILCLLREQASMIETAYRQVVSEGYPGGIEDFLSEDHWKGVGFDWGFYEYDRLVDKYFELYDREQVSFLPYEMMSKALPEFLSLLCNVLGISNMEDMSDKGQVNRSLSSSGALLVRIMNRAHKSEYNPFPCMSFGNRMHALILRFSKRCLKSRSKVLSDVKVRQIHDYYRESNARLVKQLGKRFDDYLS